MKVFLNTTTNLAKMFLWIVLLIVLLHWLGLVYGILLFAATSFIWNIILTLKREANSENQNILKTIFSTDAALPFTVYGCYCSPKYGVDGRTNGLKPIDSLDDACRTHDNVMLATTYQLLSKDITKAEYIKAKNQGDWRFMKSAITSDNSASGMYLVGLLIGFTFRIIGRTITKA